MTQRRLLEPFSIRRSLGVSLCGMVIFLSACGSVGPSSPSDPFSGMAVTITPILATSTPPATPTQFDQALTRLAPISFDEYNSIFGEGGLYPAQHLAVDSNGRFLASLGFSVSLDRKIVDGIFIWDIHNLARSLVAYRNPISKPSSIAFSHSGDLIAIGGRYVQEPPYLSEATVIDWRTGRVLGSRRYEGSNIVQIEFSRDDSELFLQDDSSNLTVLDMHTFSTKRSIKSSGSHSNGFAMSADGSMLAIRVGGIQFLDPRTFDPLAGHASSDIPFRGVAGSLSISPDGRWLAVTDCANYELAGCTEGVTYLWDLNQGELFHALKMENIFRALDFNYDGSLLAVGGSYGLTVWDVRSGTRLTSPYSKKKLSIHQILFHPTENVFVASTNVGIVFGQTESDRSSWEFTTLDRFGAGRIFYVTVIGANQPMYMDASLSSAVVYTLKAGQAIYVSSGQITVDGNTWWYVYCVQDDGTAIQMGWVVEDLGYYSPLP